MPEPEADKRERSPALVVAAIVVLAIPVLYVLSSGPVIWLFRRGYIDQSAESTIEWFYWPTTTFLNASKIGSQLMEWWVDLWE